MLGKLPYLHLVSRVHVKGYGEQDQTGCLSSWEYGCTHADMSLGGQQVLNSHSICSSFKLVAGGQLIVILSKARWFLVWLVFTQLNCSHLVLALKILKDSSGNKLKNE